MYILVNGEGDPVGQIRFEIQDDGSAEVNISIAREQRGYGYGVAALRLACDEIVQSARVKQIVAHIKPENTASVCAFEKAGFTLQGKEIMKGCEALRMIMDMNQG